MLMVDAADNSIKFTWSIRSLAASSGRVAATQEFVSDPGVWPFALFSCFFWFLSPDPQKYIHPLHHRILLKNKGGI